MNWRWPVRGHDGSPSPTPSGASFRARKRESSEPDDAEPSRSWYPGSWAAQSVWAEPPAMTPPDGRGYDSSRAGQVSPRRPVGFRPGVDQAVAPGHPAGTRPSRQPRSEEHTSELQSLAYLVCRLLL